MPTDKKEALPLNRALAMLAFEQNELDTILPWLVNSVKLLDEYNRDELNDKTLFRQQGAAKAISQLVGLIKKAREEVTRLRDLPSEPRTY